ncbi:MAG: cysteine desulfurase [Firmicutes bacterium]|nr:cysteine desulfurase [Bacillota bacterium]
MKQDIYLDNSATTKPSPEAVQAVVDYMEKIYGNPSSVHRKGLEAARAVTRAREAVADQLKVNSKQVVFTSGGTESNNLAIKGTASSYSNRGKHIITTAIEHPAVRNVCRDLAEDGFEITYLPVDEMGIIQVSELAEALREDTILVSIMYVNNETGSVQPLDKIAGVIKRAKKDGKLPLWHVDAVQALGRLPVLPAKMGMDLVSFSGHKVHGPKGIGALYVGTGVSLRPQIVGGGQEGDLRSGTENVPGIAGFGAAVRGLVKGEGTAAEHMASLRKLLVEGVLNGITGCRLNGPPPGNSGAAPHIANISFNGVRGEVLVHWLENEGIYASTGSACSSRKQVEHSVLKTLGLSEGEAEGALRFSFSSENTVEDVELVIRKLKEGVEELRSFAKMQ